MIYDKIDNLGMYNNNSDWFKICSFIKILNAETEPKRYELVNGAYCNVVDAKTKDPNNAHPENHINFIDIQITLKGIEVMEVYALKDLHLRSHDNTSDLLLYESSTTPHLRYVNEIGYCSVYFTDDAHRPQLGKDNQVYEIKKAIVKVPATLFFGTSR